MMGEILDFHDEKASRKPDRSEHFLSLDLFMDVDTSALWARVDNVGEVDVDPDWQRFIAAQLRRLAWIADGMAARDEGTQSAPIACVTVFEDARVSTMHNDDMVVTDRQADWVGEQLAIGCDEIRAALNEGVDASSTPHDTIDEMIRELNATCENEGHHFAASSISPDTDYCQACGATRARISEPPQEKTHD